MMYVLKVLPLYGSRWLAFWFWCSIDVHIYIGDRNNHQPFDERNTFDQGGFDKWCDMTYTADDEMS